MIGVALANVGLDFYAGADGDQGREGALRISAWRTLRKLRRVDEKQADAARGSTCDAVAIANPGNSAFDRGAGFLSVLLNGRIIRCGSAAGSRREHEQEQERPGGEQLHN